MTDLQVCMHLQNLNGIMWTRPKAFLVTVYLSLSSVIFFVVQVVENDEKIASSALDEASVTLSGSSDILSP